MFQGQNITLLAATAFSIPASANFPVIALTLFWRPLTTVAAISGGAAGLVSALAALLLGPGFWVAMLVSLAELRRTLTA